MAETVGLKDELWRDAAYLSHGQKQWLEIGMLILQDPRLLLIDEPAAGMTDEETAKTARLLLDLSKKHSIIVIEHDMEFVKQLARKVTVLCEGKVLTEGPIEKVQEDPRGDRALPGPLPQQGERKPPRGGGTERPGRREDLKPDRYMSDTLTSRRPSAPATAAASRRRERPCSPPASWASSTGKARSSATWTSSCAPGASPP